MIELVIPGKPVTQGSYPVMRGRLVTTAAVRAYRENVALVVAAADLGVPLAGPVHVRADFQFVRPKAHRGAAGIRPAAPAFPTSRANGDLDKCARALLDALTAAHVWLDDSLVVELNLTKVWATSPGTRVVITPADARPGHGTH